MDGQSLLDQYPFPGQLSDPAELEKAKYLALMRVGMGLLGKERIGTATGHGLATYATMEENARRNADQKMQEMQAKMKYAIGMKKDAEEQALRKDLGGIFSGQPQLDRMGPGGPTPANASAVTLDNVQKYMTAADKLASLGRTEDAKRMADIAQQWRTKYNTTPHTFVKDGKRVSAQLSETGEFKIVPLEALPDYKEVSTNEQKYFVDPVTGQETPRIPMGISPADTKRIALDQARLGIEQQRLADARANGPILETSEGPVRVNRDNTTTQLTSATGEPLRPKLSEATKTRIAENNVALAGIDEALRLTKEYPKAFGVMNYQGDAVRQRTDPKGVDARASVGIVSSTKVHDLSGAAVSAAESPRLQPHIPVSTDESPVVIKKLNRMRREVVLMQSELSGGRSLKETINAPSITEVGESKITGLTKTGYESMQKNYEALAANLKKDDEERARLGR